MSAVSRVLSSNLSVLPVSVSFGVFFPHSVSFHLIRSHLISPLLSVHLLVRSNRINNATSLSLPVGRRVMPTKGTLKGCRWPRWRPEGPPGTQKYISVRQARWLTAVRAIPIIIIITLPLLFSLTNWLALEIIDKGWQKGGNAQMK